MDHSFPLDIIVFAVIAAVLFFRLRKVLGERSDGEPPAIDPELLLKARNAAKPTVSAITTDTHKTASLPAPVVTNWTQGMPDYGVVLNATAHHRLLPLAAVDPNFQPQVFLQGARRAYEVIVQAFAKGDMTTLETLLTPELTATFKAAIDARVAAAQTFDLVLHGVSRAVISDASLDGTEATVSVDFTSEQSITQRDKDGAYVDHQDGSKHTLHERWQFTNDLKDDEIIWRLSDTDHLDD